MDTISIPENGEFLRNHSVNLDVVNRKKFLVVEDDYSMQSFWEQIIRMVDSDAVVRWATTEEGAEKQIRDRLKNDDSFDVIIADIFLAGEKNGIDLWRRYGKERMSFVFTSGISTSRFNELIGGHKFTAPSLIQKPLDPRRCVESLEMILNRIE